MSSSLVRVLHSLVIVVILGILAYDAYVNFRKLNLTTQTFNVINSNELVPPALTFCIQEETTYSFEIKVYNQTVARGDYLQSYSGDSPELTSLYGQVNRCWILKPPANNQALIKNPPPTPNVPALVFTTVRGINGNTPTRPLLVNIFDPLQQETLFDFNRFLTLDPDVNRAVQFTRTRRIDIKGTTTNDIKYNIIDEYRDPTQSTSSSSTNQFVFRAASFGIEESKEVKVATLPSIIFDILTFLGVLIGRIYFPLVGEGKYRPWGYIHQLVGYYPVEHIKRSGKDVEQGRSKINNGGFEMQNNGPDDREVLNVYLEKVKKAKYSHGVFPPKDS